MVYVCAFTKMQFQNILFVVLFLLLNASTSFTDKLIHALTHSNFYEIPSSPCPQLFQYKNYGNDWIGELEVPSPPIEHHEVILHITLSLRAAIMVSAIGTL